MIARLLTRFAARRLARRGAEKARASVHETAQQIRKELGLPPHPALRA